MRDKLYILIPYNVLQPISRPFKEVTYFPNMFSSYLLQRNSVSICQLMAYGYLELPFYP